MDTDELDPHPRPLAAPDFEMMSVEALQDYISSLEQEILRARAAIAAKDGARTAAERFFKTR